MRYSNGYLTLLVASGTSVRAHWSLPLPFVLLGFGSEGSQGVAIAWALIVLVHELGHALLARRYHLPVLALEFHAFGGRCVYAGHASPMESALIAWGGVLGQAVLFGVAVLADVVYPVKTERAAGAISALIAINAFVAVINLIPHRALDGGTAWGVLGLIYRRLRARRAARRAQSVVRRATRPPRTRAGGDGPTRLH